MAFQISKEITPTELSNRLNIGEAPVIIDVREPAEWAEGHIAGAKHIPLGQLTGRLDELDKDIEMIIVCRSGGRSGLACELLSEHGFDVVNMTGGLMSWNDELI
ncbi:rhodanese-related sulfurtransferase [Paenibacillus anaericanus]|uniref:rhodanese-like domain-containing protein n=1 Tax=Paenibacillus anaericanus TaxID=170367 RepID=UPI002783D69F|nr:rhodanese-like domain-containing protein [Paenibacillus anaericanus]MDQ0089122.1 rhodanese-related sulfurtransferase [Paenibacillus anaericanus]